MAWCPKCKSEYEDHIKVCATCNVNLVDHLNLSKQEYRENTFLTNVASMNEANLIISLLNANDIQAFYKSKESGEYLQITTGVSFYGVDLFVPDDLLPKAKAILDESIDDNVTDNMNNMEEYSDLKNLDSKIKNKRRVIVYSIVLLFFVLPILLLLLNQIVNLYLHN